MKTNRWLPIGGVVTVLVVLLAAFLAWRIVGFPAVNHETQHQKYDHAVSKIVFHDMDSNDIAVRGTTGATGVDVTRKLSWSTNSPTISETWSGDVLNVSVDCHSFGIGASCSVDYTVEVPPAVAVEADVSSGDIAVSGLSAPAKLSTSSGDVRVHGLTAESLDARSSSGDLIFDGLAAKSVKARATSGDIRLTFASAPTTVDAQSTSGDVTVTMPHSDMTYKVSMDATSGDISSDIGNNDTGTGSLSLRATSGDIRVRLA
jgi:hypothetical protein